MADALPKKLSVVIPCFNEEANLRRFPDEVFAPLEKTGPELEVVLVDDGSRDATFTEMAALGKRFRFVKVFRHAKNLGLGAALKTGFSLSTGDAILALDGDLTFHPNQVPALLAAYGPGVDCVMGSPFLGSVRDVHPVRLFLSRSVNSIYRAMLGRRLSSVSAIFRLYRASKLKSLALSSTSFDINAEILFKLLAADADVVEVPVALGRRTHGVSKINTPREVRNHLRMFVRILKWKLGSST